MPHTPHLSFRPLSLWLQVTGMLNREIIQAKKMRKICCQNAIAIQFSPFSCKTQSCKTQEVYTCSCSSSEAWRSHSNAICRHWGAKSNRTYAQRLQKLHLLAAPKPDLDAQAEKRQFWSEALCQRNLIRKIIGFRNGEMLPKHDSQLSCSRYNAICDLQLQN